MADEVKNEPLDDAVVALYANGIPTSDIEEDSQRMATELLSLRARVSGTKDEMVYTPIDCRKEVAGIWFRFFTWLIIKSPPHLIILMP